MIGALSARTGSPAKNDRCRALNAKVESVIPTSVRTRVRRSSLCPTGIVANDRAASLYSRLFHCATGTVAPTKMKASPSLFVASFRSPIETLLLLLNSAVICIESSVTVGSETFGIARNEERPRVCPRIRRSSKMIAPVSAGLSASSSCGVRGAASRSW
eukprot:Amastigsp_a1257_120.p3 type:complete len:159 gc:universal Amastigsp_a1257_120:422-898(+)